MKIKLTATILSILIICSLCTFSVSAATYGDLTYSVSNDEVTVTDCNDSVSGAVTIPAEINGLPVTSIGIAAFYNCYALTEVSIPDSVTFIDYNAFGWCKSLTQITIPDSVSSIGSNSFEKCTNLKEISIPDSVTHIGDFAFYDCHNLLKISISDNVESIGDFAFDNTAYYNDSNNWKNDILYIDNHLIAAKLSITNCSIKPGTKTIAATAFESCHNLTNVFIPDSVTNIGYSAFDNCNNLTAVTIPKNLTCIEPKVFYDCDSLEEITIPDSVTSIGNYAFAGCDCLIDITIPDSVTYIGWEAFDTTAFYNDNNNWYNGVLYIDNHLIRATTLLTNCVVKSGTKTIASDAFKECADLTNIIIPDTVTSIGDYAFEGCIRLTSISLPPKITMVKSYTFAHCINLTCITIPDAVTLIEDSAFYGCKRLAAITIPDKVTTIGDFVFYGCSSLAEITIPDSVRFIGDSFYDTAYYHDANNWENDILYINHHLILAKKTVANCFIKSGTKTIAGSAFELCTNLTAVTLADSVTTINNNAFWNCNLLSEITIPDSVTYIGSGAFKGCGLSNVYYIGSTDEWKSINIYSDKNDPLFEAIIHYNYRPLTTTVCEKQNSSYNFSINCSQALKDEFLAVILYSTDGSLLGFKAVPCNGGTSYTASVPTHDNAGYAKVIVWELANGLNPLGDAERINI